MNLLISTDNESIDYLLIMNPIINIYCKSGQFLPDITATSGKKLCSVYS